MSHPTGTLENCESPWKIQKVKNKERGGRDLKFEVFQKYINSGVAVIHTCATIPIFNINSSLLYGIFCVLYVIFCMLYVIHCISYERLA